MKYERRTLKTETIVYCRKDENQEDVERLKFRVFEKTELSSETKVLEF